MFVRDHDRPVFHGALGLDPTKYDMQVFRITTEISKQVFPVGLDVDNPAFLAGLMRLLRINRQIEANKRQYGIGNIILNMGLKASAALTLGRLYLMRPREHALPKEIRIAPAW